MLTEEDAEGKGVKKDDPTAGFDLASWSEAFGAPLHGASIAARIQQSGEPYKRGAPQSFMRAPNAELRLRNSSS